MAEVPAVDLALPAVRKLFLDAGIAYRIAGGVAVIHHGYERLTVDIDALVEAGVSQPTVAAVALEQP